MKKLLGYWKRAGFEYQQWKWRRYFNRCNAVYQKWEQKWLASDAEILLGPHFLKEGGVRNHILAIQKFSSRRVKLVPGERELSKFGSNPFTENSEKFLKLPPPKTAIAVHSHVLPWLIDWAEIHSSDSLRWIHTHHSLYYPSNFALTLEPWERQLNEAMLRGARKSHLCLCVSRWQQSELKQDYGIEATFIPNGVDVSLCDNANSSNFKKIHKMDSPFALWIGRFDPIKNPLDFVRLAIETPGQHFVMIGGVTKEKLNREHNLSIPKNLKLLPAMSHREVLDAIAACNVLVVTSLREGLPTLVLEAMAMQKQIIVPNEFGCLDATDGDANARIYTHGNLTQLREKLSEAMADKSLRYSARQRVLSEFDWRVVAAKLDRIYAGEVP
jgi:glycosyltransferase involved in cell wall biosynthesis